MKRFEIGENLGCVIVLVILFITLALTAIFGK